MHTVRSSYPRFCLIIMPTPPVVAAANLPRLDDDDVMWLNELVGRQAVPRRRPVPPHSSDDEWLEMMLNIARPAYLFVHSPPVSGGAPRVIHRYRSPRPTACKSRPLTPPTTGGSSSGHEFHSRPRVGSRHSCPAGCDVPLLTFVSFEQLQSHLAAPGAQLPFARWAPQAQDTIVQMLMAHRCLDASVGRHRGV